MLKRILAFFLIMILIMSPVSVYASSSGTLTVASGSGSAVGGLFSDYGVNSRTSAIALTMVFLNSLGATVKLTDQAVQAGKKVQDVIMDKFAQWVGGSSAESMTEKQREELKKRFKVINGGNGNNESGSDGPNVGPDGKIYFGLGVLGILTEFLKFLQSNNDIKSVPVSENGSSVDLGFCTTVLSTSFRYSTDGGTVWNVYEFSKPCAIFKVIDKHGKYRELVSICNEDIDVHTYHVDKGNIYGHSYTTKTVEDGFSTFHSLSGNYFTNLEPENAYSISDDTYYTDIKYLITKWEVMGEPGEITEDGIYADDLDISKLENPDNKDFVVDPGLLENVSPDSDQQVSIPDYLQYILDNANANAYSSQDSLEVPVTDPITLSPGTLTVPVQEQNPITNPLPADYTTPENTPVNPVQDPSTPAEPGDAMPRLTFPLDEYFPFCIPFDIYALLSKFSADPVTPVFDVGFTEPFTNSQVNLHIDLTPWNGVATAIRTAELGAFIVGLALLSKQIFTRG